MSAATLICDRTRTLWHAGRVRRLVRERLGLGPQSLLTVVELPCPDPDCLGPTCNGPATQITILGLDLRRLTLTIHRPMADVTARDLDGVLV
ncbi:MAG: hypothetical protein JJT81_14365 [Rubellimicrobium sp.]|nr:hypothetical protein [Rubellimicrobium sp.]